MNARTPENEHPSNRPTPAQRRPSRLSGRVDAVIALAGNPNTGKSTVFNALTGLHQHTGNWTGKTVGQAAGIIQRGTVAKCPSAAFPPRSLVRLPKRKPPRSLVEALHLDILQQSQRGNKIYQVVDLPGTYSLLSTSPDEDVARDFLLFAQPACTIVVVDASILERNLNLVLQILEITPRVVVAVNLVDEAKRQGIIVDCSVLARELGVPVCPIVASAKSGIAQMLDAVQMVVEAGVDSDSCQINGNGHLVRSPLKNLFDGALGSNLQQLVPLIQEVYPQLGATRWVAMQLLDGDAHIRQLFLNGEMGTLVLAGGRSGGFRPSRLADFNPGSAAKAVAQADSLRRAFKAHFHEVLVQTIYAEAERIAQTAVTRGAAAASTRDAMIDKILTSPWTGLPLMGLGLAFVFWLTIVGANYPSQLIANALFWLESVGAGFFTQWGIPAAVTGFLWHGVYRGLAWVVAVMLPPMAIFFPLFTIMEDLGVLPRIAFNFDRLFKSCGAHGKQVLTMCMGFGCNAAGIVATRIIESPRERLIAILTNNFVPCNGRFPTLIILANLFVAASFPPVVASLVAAGTVMLVVVLGIVVTLAVSAFLSQTLLKGEPSSFVLELPPFRRPDIPRILYTSFVQRTIMVLNRAVVMAAPAGGVIWLANNISIHGVSVARIVAQALDPLGRALGLDGVILLAYIIAIPANEIVVPTILMTYMNAAMMVQMDSWQQLQPILIGQQGWTLKTAVCLMLFSLLHNPCSTAILSIWRETRSWKWTLVGTFLPLVLAFAVTFLVARAFFLFGY